MARGELVRLVVTRRFRAGGAQLRLRVAGAVDLATAPTLAEAFDLALRDLSRIPGADELVVDLRAVDFLSAAGLRVLHLAHRRCAEVAVVLRVVADQRAVTRPMRLAGLHHVLELHTVPVPDGQGPADETL